MNISKRHVQAAVSCWMSYLEGDIKRGVNRQPAPCEHRQTTMISLISVKAELPTLAAQLCAG